MYRAWVHSGGWIYILPNVTYAWSINSIIFNQSLSHIHSCFLLFPSRLGTNDNMVDKEESTLRGMMDKEDEND